MDPIKQVAADLHVPAANTAAVVTLTADPNRRHALVQVVGSYSAAPTGGRLTIEDGAGTTVFDINTTDTLVDISFDPALLGSYNTAMVVTLAAGGAGISGKVNVRHTKV